MKGDEMTTIPNACGYCDHSRYQPEEEGGGTEFCALGGREINVDAVPPADCRLRRETDEQPDLLPVPPKAVRDGVWVSREKYERLRALCDAAVKYHAAETDYNAKTCGMTLIEAAPFEGRADAACINLMDVARDYARAHAETKGGE